ncbi:MAG TPA: TlpA disulfide reductase family protein [Terracidiphilus sp.]|nr:TlpA disulfide reductase family protein [Terracidiphilus sp.]
MMPIRRTFSAAAILLAAPLLYSQASESAIAKQIGNLRSVPTAQRPEATIKIATDIRTLPAGPGKLKLADSLAHLVTEGDQGIAALQSVADTLSQALAESPVPPKNGQPPEPYLELASLVRYESVTTSLKDPLLAKASQVLVANDADVEKADFTLKDLHGKKVTLSELRGKIVMVNFWATWCSPCRLEMPDLDKIYTHFQPQGLVILAITDEDAFKVNSFIAPMGYHPPVLIDTGGAVHKLFHIEGIPKTFLFNRDGKLIGETIDQCTGLQFLKMLSKTDLHP